MNKYQSNLSQKNGNENSDTNNKFFSKTTLDKSTINPNTGGVSNNNLNTTSQGFNPNPTDNFKVVIRVRPALPREIEEDLPFRSIVLVSNESKSCNLVEYLGAELTEKERQREWIENPNLFQLHRFSFDHVFDMDSTQKEVYEITAKPAIMSCLEGYNSTVFAYGQTGTGKTYTMEGFTYSSSDTHRGIIQRSIEEIFNYIEEFSNSNTKFMVRASYIQIYNEQISDLLKIDKTNLQIREDKKRGVYVEGQSEWAVRTPSDIYALLKRGATNRTTSSTNMNDVSSRSHAVFRITVEQMTVQDGQGTGNNSPTTVTQIKVGKLNLVDLAGSERIRVTGAKGKQLEESKNINRSLSALGNVIYALTDPKGRSHIPYRDSKLTRLLEDSLGGNCKTTMMAMISPAHESFNESLSTLHFARRAKNIKNKPKINEDVDHKALIRQYEEELKKLRAELDRKNKLISTNSIKTNLNVNDYELVSQLEEQKKRAEEDKNLAIQALEQASKQYLHERDEKKKLEQKIQMMNSQMLVGGNKIEDTPQFRNAIEQTNNIMKKRLEEKLEEIEKERKEIEEGKAQVEKYKQLLLKQRDIMIALTNKLNERDEMIVQLQEEIDAYDKINREQEELVESRNERVTTLENILRRHNLAFPEDVMNNVVGNSGGKMNRKNNNEKVYIPYEVEKNAKDLEGALITMLSADEKVKELNYIIKEQEKEISVLRILSQRLVNQAKENESLSNNTNFNEMYLKDKNIVEVNLKASKLENENLDLNEKLQEKDELINFVKQENETLNELYYNVDAKLKDIQAAKNGIIKSLNQEVKAMFESILNSLEKGNIDKIAKDLGGLYKYLTDLVHTIQEYKDPANELNLDSHNNSNINNNYFEDDLRKSSYITQNYEKFKQQQQKEKPGSNQLFNMQNNRASSFNNSNFIIDSKSNSNSNTHSQNNSFIGSKSNIIQSLVSKTPNKHINNTSNSTNFQNKTNTTSSSTSKVINPNPITSHLKSGGNNEKFVNKFMLNNQK